MTNILFTTAYYDGFTGSQQSMYPLVVDAEKLNTTLLLPKWGECAERFQAADVSINIIRYPDRLDKFQGELLSTSLYEKSLAGCSLLRYHIHVILYLIQNSPQVVYCNDVRSVFMFGIPAKLLRIPVIWYVRIDTPINKVDRMGVRIADHILTISDGVRSRFTDSELSKYSDKFKTLYTGVDLDQYSPTEDADSTEESVTFIQVASIQPRKGQLDLIHAIKGLLQSNNNIQLQFAGNIVQSEMEYKRKIDKVVKEAEIEDQVEFLGWIDDVAGVLHNADVFVLPSYNEGFPRSILEAFAAGLPVIATDAGGTSEIVDNGQNGFLIPIEDRSELEEKIRILATDTNLRKEMGTNGRKTVEQDFSIERYVTEFEKFINETVISSK